MTSSDLLVTFHKKTELYVMKLESLFLMNFVARL